MSRLVPLFLLLLLTSACGGPAGGPTPTALPPLTRVPQPTPNFGQAPAAAPRFATSTPTPTPERSEQTAALRDRLEAEVAAQQAALQNDGVVVEEAAADRNQDAGTATVAPPSLQSGAEASNATVVSPGLNVRAGPGTDYPIVFLFDQGERIQIEARNDSADWVLASLPADQVGWVFAPLIAADFAVDSLPVSEFVSAEPRPAPASQPAGAVGAVETTAAAVPGLRGSLVFEQQSGGDIYHYELASGRLRRLTAGSDPALSPDGRTVAFTRGGAGNGVYLIDVDGSNERLIFGASAPGSPKWSPDGSLIAFHQQTGSAEPCRLTAMFGCIPQAEVDRVLKEFADLIPADFDINRWPLIEQTLRNLTRIDPNGGSYRDLPSLPTVGALDWANWGIVYQSSAGLQFSEDRPDAQTKPLLNETRFQDPDWQPGGNQIVFMSREGDHWEIFRANDDGGAVVPLTRPPLFRNSTVHNVSPAWSPDGQWIVFVSNRSGSWRLWVMDGDGGSLQQLPIELDLTYQFQAEQMVDWGP